MESDRKRLTDEKTKVLNYLFSKPFLTLRRFCVSENYDNIKNLRNLIVKLDLTIFDRDFELEYRIDGDSMSVINCTSVKNFEVRHSFNIPAKGFDVKDFSYMLGDKEFLSILDRKRDEYVKTFKGTGKRGGAFKLY